jgi:hypothetical protein
MDGWITQKVRQMLFLYKLFIQNLDEIFLHKYCERRASVVI